MSVRVLLADDTFIIRKAIRALLNQDAEIELVGEAVNFPQAVGTAAELKPHIVIVDLHLPDREPRSNEQPTFAAFGCPALAVSVWYDSDAHVLAQRLGAVALPDKANLTSELIPFMKQLADRAPSKPGS
jgi:DNA-binding NarL/FixJ family response regulator